MKFLWCWRCKAEMPMLDEKEYQLVWSALQKAEGTGRDPRKAALAEYERLTGCDLGGVFNAWFHHRISMYGPPCPNCGKVLRTPVAYKCFECGLVLHEPNWSFLFHIEPEPFVVKSRGVVLIGEATKIRGRLEVGDEVEIGDGDRRMGPFTVRGIESFTGSPSAVRNLGVLISAEKLEGIRAGQDVWIVSSPRWASGQE